MSIFKLEISRRAPSFGESTTAERARIAALLQEVAGRLTSGAPVGITNAIEDAGGGAVERSTVGSFAFGAGAVNEVREVWDHRHVSGRPTCMVVPREQAAKYLSEDKNRFTTDRPGLEAR